MKDIDISDITMSFDETYHIYKDKPLYEKRFKRVMSFHPPGIAACEDESGAYHINIKGEPIYPERYKKTYGFYEGIATVVDNSGYFHIDVKGNPIHNRRFEWAGNFQEGRCVVRDFDGLYFHIKKDGTDAYEKKYSYVGDYKYGIAVVYDLDGYATHIDKNGNKLHGKRYIELGVYHKGYATARDEAGYFHIDKKGNALYERRFEWVEPFYNDYALARDKSGQIYIIDTDGSVVKEIRDVDTDAVYRLLRADLMNNLVGYWDTQIIYSIVKSGIMDFIERNGGATFDEIKENIGMPEPSIRMILEYLYINKMVQVRSGVYTLTKVGRVLTEHSDGSLKYAALMWGSEHYRVMGYLYETLIAGKEYFSNVYGSPFFDYFRANKDRSKIYSKAMEEYSGDYSSLVKSGNFSESKIIMDVGGGDGALVKKIIREHPNIKEGWVLDLDFTDTSDSENIKYIKGSFFEPLPKGADTIIASRVLHDWPDDKALRILSNIWEALPANGKLMIFELIKPEVPEEDLGVRLNFNLLVMVGGKERTLGEFENLLFSTGFKISSVIRGDLVSLVEAVKMQRK